MKKLKIESVVKSLQNGSSVINVGKEFGVSYQAVYQLLNNNKIKLKDLRNGTPQSKAWDTRKKDNAIKAHKNAPSPGYKAAIARKFNTDFGIKLADYLTAKAETIVKTPKVKTPKVKPVKVASTKESFKQKELELMIPYSVKELFDKLYNRIEVLEKKLMKI